ncbi:chloride channel protein [Aquihabitans sp. McL0605]|uniref:chloride channel protein n=1 Tax=Aquihabitans sp. McL0605 TaxID=3415671 RepID=UPI003CE6FC5B
MVLISRTSPKRLFVLTILAACIGMLGGAAAFLLVHLIGLLTNLLLFHRVGWDLPSFAHLHRSPALVLVPMGGAFVVSCLARWSPEIRGHGIPEAMEAVLSNQSRVRPRTAVAKPISAAIAIGTGGPFGAEGPIIVTGGAIGSLVGQVVPTSPSERKILLACGAAAGMSATFGSPLAAVVLAIELLLFEFSSRAFVPLVVASSLAAGVHSIAFGSGPLFHVPPHDYTGLDKLPFYALLGVACGLLAVIVTKGLFLAESGFRRLPIDPFWHPVIGAAGFALIGLAVPRALGVGYDAISDVLASRLALGTVLVLGLAKVGAWWIALASGTSGGTLAPLLLISGCFGTAVGVGVEHLVPSAQVSPGAFALVAMAATFGASVGATFTAIVFLFELTRDYQIILPLMLASVLAQLVASALLTDTLMTEKLTRRGLHVQGDYGIDALEGSTVREIMTTEVETLDQRATVAEARELLAHGPHGAYPIVDGDGRCVGIVAREDFLEDTADEVAPISEVASTNVVTVSADDTVLDALSRILDEGIGHLPVVDGDRLIGLVTRTDVLRARSHQRELEHRQPGLRIRPRARSAATRDEG